MSDDCRPPLPEFMSLLPLAACLQHPQERVVGVCSACLAQRLHSLVRSHHLPPDPAGSASPRRHPHGSPPPNPKPESGNSSPVKDKHMQTITEEESSAAGEPNAEGSDFASSKASRLHDADDVVASASKPFEARDPSGCLPSGNGEVNLDSQEASRKLGEGKPFSDRHRNSDQDIRLGQLAKTCGSAGKATTVGAELTPKGVAKSKKIKSSDVLRADDFEHVPRTSSHREQAAANQIFKNVNDHNSAARKVSLRSLFELDDEQRQEMKSLEYLLARDARMHNKETFGTIDGTDERRSDHETLPDSSHDMICCPCHALSSSTSSSIVSSACPARIKQSVLFNSLLCRKTRDAKHVIREGVFVGKRSRVHDLKHRNDIENEFAQAGNDDRFIRATYIATESRAQSMRRCRSKIELPATRSSFSFSEPTSPGTFHVDSRSERKFNFTARALAIDVPSMFQPSVALADPAAGSSQEQQNSQQEKCNQNPRSPTLDKLPLDSAASCPSEIINESSICHYESRTGGKDPPFVEMTEEEAAEDNSGLFSTPVVPEGMAIDSTIPTNSRSVYHSRKAEIHENDDATETELIKVCQRVVDSHHRWTGAQLSRPLQRSACERSLEGENGTEACWRRTGSGEEGETEEGEALQGKDVVYVKIAKLMDCQAEKSGETTGDWDVGHTEFLEASGGEDTELDKRGQELESKHEEEQLEVRMAGLDQRVELEEGVAGEVEERSEQVQAACERSDSSKAGLQRQQHVIWEPYCKSGRISGSSNRTSRRWPRPSHTVRVAPDHPLLRFYLTPLRSSGRSRSRHNKSPRRLFWPLVFV